MTVPDPVGSDTCACFRQLSLEQTGIPTPPDLRLTARQRFALEFIGQLGPLPSEELGAALHEYRMAEGKGGHPAIRTCQFCRPEGAQMGARLRELGLVQMRRGKGWYVPGRERSVVSELRTALRAEDSEIPF